MKGRKKMDRKCNVSYVKCGKVFQPDLPNQLDPSEPPILLAEVTVDIKHIPRPCVLVKFSEFINLTIFGLNPKLNILFRLVREDKCLKYAQILQEWEFEFESSEPIEIANIDANQPTVLNYCDCLDHNANDSFTYRLEIVQIETNNVRSYGITNKSITATVISEFNYNKNFLPFVKCGAVFNPVLPLQLNKNDQPVILTQLTINIKKNSNTCILVNFSSFITSILKEADFNDLTFRLVKTCSNSTTEVLREWPFRRAFVNDTNIKEPLVYNFCECLNSKFDMCCTYTIELVEVNLSNNSYYNITQKSMTAQVYYGTDQQELC